MEVALVIIGVIVFIAGIFYLSYLYEKKRRLALQEVASKLECTFSEDGSAIHTELDSYHLFSSGHSRKAFNVIKSEKADWDVAAFDYKYTIGSGKNQTTYNQTVVRVKTTGLDLPHFELRPENFFHKIGSMFGAQDIDFDEYPDFSKRYLLKSQEEARVREEFNEPVIRFFENFKDMCAEGKGDTLLVYRQGHRMKPEQIEERIKEALELLACFVGARHV